MSLALKRDTDPVPFEPVFGEVYEVRMKEGGTSKMTPYSMQIQLADIDEQIGEIIQEAPPEGETATGGWGPVEDATWNGSAWVRPLLGSTPREVVQPMTLAQLIANVLVTRLQADNPSQEIDPAAVLAFVQGQVELLVRMDALEDRVTALEA